MQRSNAYNPGVAKTSLIEPPFPTIAHTYTRYLTLNYLHALNRSARCWWNCWNERGCTKNYPHINIRFNSCAVFEWGHKAAWLDAPKASIEMHSSFSLCARKLKSKYHRFLHAYLPVALTSCLCRNCVYCVWST